MTWSFAETSRDRNPAVAYLLAPANGRVAARFAFDAFVARPSADPNSPAVRIARKALRHDPTAVQAVAVLGLQAALRGDKREARRLFAYSQTLSRRNLPTQIWAIEDAVGQGNVAAALGHYDTALRTSPVAPDVLYPVLTAALAEPQVRTELTRTFRRQPPWEADFVAYALANGVSPLAMVALFDDMHRARVPVSPEAAASLVNRLVLTGAFDQAWQFYSSVHPGVDRRRSRDPRFTANIGQPSPFDWIMTNSSDVSASLQRGDTGGALQFSISPNGGGTVAEQLQMLPEGRYRIVGQSSDIEQEERALPFWVLQCRGAQELARVVVSASRFAGGRFSGEVDVPSDCPVQVLRLVGRSSGSASETSGQIDAIALVPRH